MLASMWVRQLSYRILRCLHVRLSPVSAPPCRLPIADATYYANAHVLLHDDTCFRFAYKRNDTATIQMMDPDKTEVSPGALAYNLS